MGIAKSVIDSDAGVNIEDLDVPLETSFLSFSSSSSSFFDSLFAVEF